MGSVDVLNEEFHRLYPAGVCSADINGSARERVDGGSSCGPREGDASHSRATWAPPTQEFIVRTNCRFTQCLSS